MKTVAPAVAYAVTGLAVSAAPARDAGADAFAVEIAACSARHTLRVPGLVAKDGSDDPCWSGPAANDLGNKETARLARSWQAAVQDRSALSPSALCSGISALAWHKAERAKPTSSAVDAQTGLVDAQRVACCAVDTPLSTDPRNVLEHLGARCLPGRPGFGRSGGYGAAGQPLGAT